jgi:membrane-bound ClpP family serine protease
MTGETVTALTPYGTIMLEERRLPAKTEGTYIEAGQPVVIVEEAAFGCVVSEAEDV